MAASRKATVLYQVSQSAEISQKFRNDDLEQGNNRLRPTVSYETFPCRPALISNF